MNTKKVKRFFPHYAGSKIFKKLSSAVSNPFLLFEKVFVRIATERLTVTNNHYLILAGPMLASLHSSEVRGPSPWNNYSIAQGGLNVNTFFEIF